MCPTRRKTAYFIEVLLSCYLHNEGLEGTPAFYQLLSKHTIAEFESWGTDKSTRFDISSYNLAQIRNWFKSTATHGFDYVFGKPTMETPKFVGKRMDFKSNIYVYAKIYPPEERCRCARNNIASRRKSHFRFPQGRMNKKNL